jgi:hypothetical protein
MSSRAGRAIGKTWNHPVVMGDRVFLRNAREMACYSMAQSKESILRARNWASFQKRQVRALFRLAR